MRRCALSLLLACSAALTCLPAEDAAKTEVKTREAKEAAAKLEVDKFIAVAEQQLTLLEKQLREHQTREAGKTSLAVTSALDQLSLLGATGRTNLQVKALSSRFTRLSAIVLQQMDTQAEQTRKQSDGQKQ